MHRPFGGCTFEGEVPCSPNRDPALPRFFITHDHPRNLGQLSWVGSVDPIELARLSKAGAFKNMGYPTSVLDDDLFQAGLIKIPDEVTILVENVRGTHRREDDVVKVIAAGAQANRTMFPRMLQSSSKFGTEFWVRRRRGMRPPATKVRLSKGCRNARRGTVSMVAVIALRLQPRLLSNLLIPPRVFGLCAERRVI